MSESVTNHRATHEWLSVSFVVAVGVLMVEMLIHGSYQQEPADQILPVSATAEVAPPRGFLGMWFSPDSTRGLRVTTVIAGSPAEEAGLMPGDFITSIISKNAADATDRWDGLGGLKGDEVEIEYRRANKDRKTSAILKSSAEIFDTRHVR